MTAISNKMNEFAITEGTLLEMLQSPWCDYKTLKTPIIIRHHGRTAEQAVTFGWAEGFPNVVMLARDPECAKEVLDRYPNVKWAKEYYTDGVLKYTQLGAFKYCRDHGFKTCVMLDDDIGGFTVSFYRPSENKMKLASQLFFPIDNKELSKKILAYCIRRSEALFKKHPDVGMVGWHHRSFGYLYQNCNVVDINGGYNDYANGYIYNLEAIDRFGFELADEYDVHGENVGTYCGMLGLGMQLACLTGACISPSNDGDKSTLRTTSDAKTKNEEDWNKVKKLTPKVLSGLRRGKTGDQFIKISWKNMNAVLGNRHTQERLFYNPDDTKVINPEEKKK